MASGREELVAQTNVLYEGPDARDFPHACQGVGLLHSDQLQRTIERWLRTALWDYELALELTRLSAYMEDEPATWRQTFLTEEGPSTLTPEELDSRGVTLGQSAVLIGWADFVRETCPIMWMLAKDRVLEPEKEQQRRPAVLPSTSQPGRS